jgi:hypothetical protein
VSYTIDIVHIELPPDDGDAWDEICRLRAGMMEDDRPLPPSVRRLHERLTEIYPCIMDDPDGPWSDGPLINNFGHDLSILGISYSRVDEVLPTILKVSLEAGFSVFDGQDERFHRPVQAQQRNPTAAKDKRPWWKFW